MRSTESTPESTLPRREARGLHHHPLLEAAAQPTRAPQSLPAGVWLRVVLGFEAPFGHDGLPTVWG